MVRAASKKHGRLVWKDEGAVSKTKVVHSVVGEVPIDLRNTVKRMQVTVTIHRRQVQDVFFVLHYSNSDLIHLSISL